jgi:hypothetical protein
LRESVQLGTIEVSYEEITSTIGKVSTEFNELEYHLLERNCNHYAEALYHALIELDKLKQGSNVNIPSYVNRMAWLGSKFKCFVPEDLLNANTPDQNGGNVSKSGSTPLKSKNSVSAFSGSGRTLSGKVVVKNEESSSGGNSSIWNKVKEMTPSFSSSESSSSSPASLKNRTLSGNSTTNTTGTVSNNNNNNNDEGDNNEEDNVPLISKREKMLKAFENRKKKQNNSSNVVEDLN